MSIFTLRILYWFFVFRVNEMIQSSGLVIVSNYKYKNTGLDLLLANSEPKMNGITATTLSGFNINSTFYTSTSIGSGIGGYLYQGASISNYVPYFVQIDGGEVGAEAKESVIDISNYDKISGYLVGGGGGGGGGGGANRDGFNRSGASGAAGQQGQIVEFKDIIISGVTQLKISTGSGGGGGGGGTSQEYNTASPGDAGAAGGDTKIDTYDTVNSTYPNILTALGGGKGNGGGGGSSGQGAHYGNTESTYTADVSEFDASSNFTRNAGGGGGGVDKDHPSPNINGVRGGDGNGGSIGSALVFLLKL